VESCNLKFGVSGLLYQSDMLHDHQKESLWSQIKSEAVTGPMTGTRLKLLVSTHTNWGTWKKTHPQTRVLSDQTGFQRLYDRNPYQGHESSSRLMFDVNLKDSKYHSNGKVIGIEFGGKTKAYAFSELSRTRSPVKDVFNKVPIQIHFDHKTQTAIIRTLKMSSCLRW
jgi:hypothetical protein